MAKDDTTSEPSSAPEVNPEHVDLDVDQAETDKRTGVSPTIEEAQAAAEQTETDKDDDAIYREAASEVQVAEPEPVKKPKKSKKKLFILLLVLVLIGGGAAAWYFLVNKKSAPSPQPQTSTATQEEQQTTISYEPDTVAYSFRETEDLPFTIFWRPAIGGERSQVKKLGRGEYITQSDTYGQSVVYATTTNVNASTDGGRTYKTILELAAGEQVTSLKISTTGDNVAVAVLPESNASNTVKSVPLAGGEAAELYKSDKRGIFLYNWNEDKKQIVFGDGCYNCDGNTPDWQLLNLEDKKVTKLATDIKGDEVSEHAVSFDGGKIVIVTGVIDDSANIGAGTVTMAPYKIQLLDVATNELSVVQTLGKAGEKNANGTVKHRDIQVGFLAGTATPYYVDDSTLYTISGDEPNAFYKSDKAIQSVSFVSDTTVIVSVGNAWNDYSLVNFNTKTNESAVIFQGDANTNIFGVTTK